MASFKPRLTTPDVKDPLYLHTSVGGKNPCLLRYNGTVLPNCVGYAWGRFYEVLGSSPNLSRGDAGKWYGYTQDGYARSATVPQLGAVICWTQYNKAGHVAIVEQLNADGSIVISQSGYSMSWEKRFWTETLYPPSYKSSWMGADYSFQGFIYNPACADIQDSLTMFLDTAESHVGEGPDWTYSTSGLTPGQPWCMAFVYACAKDAGVPTDVIPKTFSCTTLARSDKGTWLKGPCHGKSVTPEPGDLILFRWSNFLRLSEYESDHVGIVTSVSNGKVYTVEGNSGSGGSNLFRKVTNNEYKLDCQNINGYWRPKWVATGSSTSSVVSNRYVSKDLYDSENTRKDATIRQIGYIDSNYQPSISTSNIKLSVINYTGVLASMFEFAATELGLTFNDSTTSTVILDELSSSETVVVNTLMDKGLNAAASVGILANIYAESSLRTNAVGDNGTSFGICQWHYDRGTHMKQMVGSDWANNLTGQLDFLWYELTSDYTSMLDDFYRLPNTKSGAQQAAEDFVIQFERPRDTEGAIKRRRQLASDYWDKIVPQLQTM